MKVISTEAFWAFDYVYVGKIKDRFNSYLFRCKQDADFNIGVYFGDEDEHPGCWFSSDVGVIAGKSDIEQGWVLDDEPTLLNIDANTEIIIEQLSELRSEYFITHEFEQVKSQYQADYAARVNALNDKDIMESIPLMAAIEDEFSKVLWLDYGIAHPEHCLINWISDLQ